MSPSKKDSLKVETQTQISTSTKGTLNSYEKYKIEELKTLKLDNENIKSNKHYENSLDSQLDFIMERTRSYDRKIYKPEIQKKGKKIPEQLEVLTSVLKELSNEKFINREKIKEIAETIELSETKVYKWFWDRKFRIESH